jgi:hypothetical protein
MIWLHPLPLSCRKTEKERQLAHGREVGVGEVANHRTARKPDPLYMIQYSLGGRNSFALIVRCLEIIIVKL